MFSSHVIAPEEHNSWFDALLKGESRRQWIILIGEQPVGSVYLTDLVPGGHTSTLGVYIAEKEARGHGVAKAALELLLDQAFLQVGLSTVAADVVDGNEPAFHLYLQVGMRRLTRECDPAVLVSATRFEISGEQWQSRRLNQGDIG